MFVSTPGLFGATLNQANSGQTITISALHAEETASFKAFVTAFTDKYTTSYNSEEVYGRMDPVQMYKGTQRVISISFDVPSEGLADAQNTQSMCAALARMQYPVYGGTSATSISESPLFKIKFGNLISDHTNGGALVGTLAGFNYDVDTDAGFHMQGTNFFPKTVRISLEFTVQHTSQIGYGSGGFNTFPYKSGPSTPSSEAASSGSSQQSAASSDPEPIPNLDIQNEGATQETPGSNPEKKEAIEEKLTSGRLTWSV